MWKAFKFVFGAILGYACAIAFIGGVIFAIAFSLGASQSQHQQPYHTTKATRS